MRSRGLYRSPRGDIGIVRPEHLTLIKPLIALTPYAKAVTRFTALIPRWERDDRDWSYSKASSFVLPKEFLE